MGGPIGAVSELGEVHATGLVRKATARDVGLRGQGMGGGSLITRQGYKARQGSSAGWGIQLAKTPQSIPSRHPQSLIHCFLVEQSWGRVGQ